MLCVAYSSIEKPHCPSIYYAKSDSWSGGPPGIPARDYHHTNTYWKTHILNVRNKANKKLGFIKRNLHSCPERIKAQAYISLVRPTLEHAVCIMGPLQKTLNRPARASSERGCSFCHQDLLNRGGLYLPSIEQFTLSNTTAQEANIMAMHALQNT